MITPLHRDAGRRQALVEISALAAVMLDITAEELTKGREGVHVSRTGHLDELEDSRGRHRPVGRR